MKQLKLPFPNPRRGVNKKPPRLEVVRSGDGHETKVWAIWCGWCRHDHRYSSRLSQEQVAAMHKDHIENICKVRVCGEDPFG